MVLTRYQHVPTCQPQNLADNNIKIIGMGGGKLRMVTHLDYTDEMHNKLITTLRNI